jgi:hypothetical protein
MDKLSERLAVVGAVDPDANSAGTLYTDNVDMADFAEALFIGMLGTGVTTGSFVFDLVEDTIDGTGTGAQTLTPARAAAALTTGDNDSQVVIQVRAEDLSEGYQYVRGRLVMTTAGADAGMLAIAGRPRFHPASDYDLASVAEIVD